MGGVFRAVVADVGPLHLDTGQLVLHDGADEAHAGVLHKEVVGGVDRVAHVDGIAHAGDDAHLLGGIAVVDAIAGAHVAHELHRRGIGRQLLALVLEIGVQHRLLDIGHIRIVFEGRLGADGQIVVIHVAEALHHAHQLQDDLVGVFVGEELDVVDLQVIAFLVAHQYTAVAVEDVAAGGGDHRLLAGHLVGAVVVFLAVDDLQAIEEDHINAEDERQEPRHGGDPAFAYESVHSVDTSKGKQQ